MKAHYGNKPDREFQKLIDSYQKLHNRVRAFVSDCGHPVPEYAASLAFGISMVRVTHLVNQYKFGIAA